MYNWGVGKIVRRRSRYVFHREGFDGVCLFGTQKNQETLIEIYNAGIITGSGAYIADNRRLLQSGMIASALYRGKRCLILNPKHPAIRELRALLSTLSGKGVRHKTTAKLLSPIPVSPKKPLAQRSHIDFRILSCLAEAGKSLSRQTLARRLPDVWQTEILAGIKRLNNAGVLTGSDERLKFSSRIPSQYIDLIKKTAAHLYLSDPRFAKFAKISGKRATAFESAKDEAPRLFGTDVRLRNLMALAKYGPLHLTDLRRITGTQKVKAEERDYAPFGRGGVVHTWKTDKGIAAMLNPKHPVAVPLRRLLLKISEIYPLPPFVPRHSPPKPPRVPQWCGDKLALFGSAIPTSILLTIGALGWTFESLCVVTAIGYHRNNVKKSLRRLEKEGVLRSDRKRRPGFDVRAVYLSKDFAAHDEMQALLKACIAVWPQFGMSAQSAIDQLTPRTKVHLRNRGLMS